MTSWPVLGLVQYFYLRERAITPFTPFTSSPPQVDITKIECCSWSHVVPSKTGRGYKALVVRHVGAILVWGQS